MSEGDIGLFYLKHIPGGRNDARLKAHNRRLLSIIEG